MQGVDEEMETIHLYVMREPESRPSIFPIIVSVLALSILIAIGVLTPYTQLEQRALIRVPAVPLFTKTFSTAITVVPTGIKTYPATFARGVLSISNGSVISQTLPAGFIALSDSGISVITDTAVFVPAGSANGYGMATVQAHSLAPGVNLSMLAINQVIGTSLFIRNLSPFTGGHPAYLVKFITSQDRELALRKSRDLLASSISGLRYPCIEKISHFLTWRCQFFTYHVPEYLHVTSVTIQGNNLIVGIVFVVHPRRIWVK